MEVCRRTRAFLAVALLSAPGAAFAAGPESFTGPVRVIDGDSLVIAVQGAPRADVEQVRVRLHGIDAPESVQQCEDARGRRYACGEAATGALRALIGLDLYSEAAWKVAVESGDLQFAGLPEVTCEGSERDRYGRFIGTCFAYENELNGYLVAEGLAVAYREYSEDYVGLEAEAKAAGRGLWAGRFVMPWNWRRGQRLP